MNPKEAVLRRSSDFAHWRNERIKSKYKDLRNCPELKDVPDIAFPQTVLVIPDGNRRYAAGHNIPKEEGHERGADKVVDLIRAFSNLPISTVIVWGFSPDNWEREQKEVDYLMRLINSTVKKLTPELMERDAKLVHLGRKDRIPDWLAQSLIEAEQVTKNNRGQIAGLAVDFGGNDQEERIKIKVANNPVLADRPFLELVDGCGLIKPADLIIRTGEERNGLIHTSDVGWLNGKPTQIFALTKPFPGVTRQDIAKAIRAFALTHRRLGA